jgi:hypothetical protein
MRLLHDAPRWLFLAALVYAPWAYGGTTPESVRVIEIFLDATLGLWALELIINRRRPRVLLAPAAISALLLILGWEMFLNARSIYDGQLGIFMPIQRVPSRISGSVDSILSFDAMCRITVLLGTVCFVADLAQQPGWLLRIWWTIGGAGASIAYLGLLQKATGADMIFWQPGWHSDTHTFFATYYYHANAGAFLNLVLPPVLGLAILSLARHDKPIVLAVWLSATLVVLLATAANTSRMAQLIGLLLIFAIAFGPARGLVHLAKRAERLTLATGAVVVLVAIVAIAQASHLDQPLQRWNESSASIPKDARWLAATASLPAVRDAGWLGFGPGTFRAVFPHYAEIAPFTPGSGWRFLHQDYLQTLIEWGWAGGAIWAVFFFGGISVALVSLRAERARQWSRRRRLFLQLALFALGGIALHALVDFPLQILSLQLYVATYLGLCWGSGRWGGESRK